MYKARRYSGYIRGDGSGKSTLIKILLGLNHEYSGDVKLASNLKISYIPQDTSNLAGSLNEYIHQQDVDETLCKTILSKLDFAKELFKIGILATALLPRFVLVTTICNSNAVESLL